MPVSHFAVRGSLRREEGDEATCSRPASRRGDRLGGDWVPGSRRAQPASVSAPAAGVTATWSRGKAIDPFTGRPSAVSCPTVRFCVAVDLSGTVVLYDGKSWSRPVSVDPAGGGCTSISCPTTSFCAAVDRTTTRSSMTAGRGRIRSTSTREDSAWHQSPARGRDSASLSIGEDSRSRTTADPGSDCATSTRAGWDWTACLARGRTSAPQSTRPATPSPTTARHGRHRPTWTHAATT